MLRLFGKPVSSARKAYRSFIEEGIATGKLTSGGLIGSLGGWGTVKSLRRLRVHSKGDERILGDSGFVESVLDEQKRG